MEIGKRTEPDAYRIAIELYAKEHKLTMKEVSSKLGMSRQNLNYHLRKKALDKDFKEKVYNKLGIRIPNNDDTENEMENINIAITHENKNVSTRSLLNIFGKIRDLFSDDVSGQLAEQKRSNAEKQLQLQYMITDKMNEYEQKLEDKDKRIAELEAEILRLTENH